MVVFVIYKKIINKEAVYKISYKKLYCKIYHSIILSSNAVIFFCVCYNYWIFNIINEIELICIFRENRINEEFIPLSFDLIRHAIISGLSMEIKITITLCDRIFYARDIFSRRIKCRYLIRYVGT